MRLCLTLRNSLQEGDPILQLPEKNVDVVRLEFSKDERQVRA